MNSNNWKDDIKERVERYKLIRQNIEPTLEKLLKELTEEPYNLSVEVKPEAGKFHTWKVKIDSKEVVFTLADFKATNIESLENVIIQAILDKFQWIK